ncbi:MAG TPA: T9SS type A sorting domain-containing protein [Cytophagaceae bacterium]|nr:T9SS type A sorting domain-containing protein [Cytophagaceae bacterium]
MKHILPGIVLVACFFMFYADIDAQSISPYAIPPKWMIGKNAGLSFTGTAANFTAGAPVFLSGNPDALAGQEATTTMCDPTKNIILYCNNTHLLNGSNGLFMTVNGGAGGQSSTQGAVSFPDPASPTNQFYVFAGNDVTGGNSAGINWFLVKNTAGVLSRVDGGPAGGNNLATGAQVTEALTVGSDLAGGYWVVGHSQANEYWSWHVTSGGVSAVSKNTGTANGGAGTASIRISPCQNKIGFVAQGGGVEVYNWDAKNGKTTGTVQTPLTGYSFGYGCEFSPDGNMFYFSTLISNPQVNQWDLIGNSVTNLGTVNACGSWMGGFSLGPDGVIYTANGNSTCQKIGTISNPNTSGVGSNYNNGGYTLTSGNTHIGLANEPWVNPTWPKVANNGACPAVGFSYAFKTYYLDNIDTARVDWDFGSGTFTGRGATPAHTYTTNGTYKVIVKVTDKYCNQIWKDSMNVVIGCALPVEWVDVTAVNEGDYVSVSWSTAKEENNNYFTIQRSGDGINFTDIGKVNSQGNSNNMMRYQFIDEAPLNGQNYYRIIQYDINNDFTISKVVTATLNQLYIGVSPNPSNSGFNIHITGSAEASYSVIDMLGREILSNAIGDKTDFSFGSDFAKGIYILKITSSNKVYTQKLVKE